MMLSPLSASAALTMLLNGCQGQTYQQLAAVLGYPEELSLEEINASYKSLVKQLLEADQKVDISLANAIFYRNGFQVKAPFMQAMNTEFNATVRELNFDHPSAVTNINKWASDNTKGKIPEVIKDISSEMVMFIMNALYFKGNWTSRFDKKATSPQPFYLADATSQMVQTMEGEVMGKPFWGNDFSVIELPYGRTNYSMVVILPGNGLNSFYQKFTPQLWGQITSGLDAMPEWGNFFVKMPRFGFSYEKYLNEQLNAMGMIDAFSPVLANLKGISDQGINVSFVKQDTFVQVNEEGTEAAAVTTIGIELVSVGPGLPWFVVDRPFVFAIRERTSNTLLFIGMVNDPEKS